MSKVRVTSESIFEARRCKEKAILLTGGTGFVGSFLAVELMKRGYPLILIVRSADSLDCFKRVEKVLEWHNFPTPHHLRIMEGDITLPKLGLNNQEYNYLLDHIGEVWHCASNTSFSEDKRTEIEKVNVQGTFNLLELAQESSCYFFHLMSTAYVAGKNHGLCQEQRITQQLFHNAYEESKKMAEDYVLEKCSEAGIIANIYRPSIIIGHSQTGRTLIFNAFYFPVKVVSFLKELFERDIRENRGQNAARMGVEITEDGQMDLPLRICTGNVEDPSVNLVPIDFVIEACLAIMHDCLGGGIFHLTNPQPIKLKKLVEFGQRYLNLRGIQTAIYESFHSRPKTVLEKRLDHFIDIYYPYLCDMRVFETSNTDGILEKHSIRCHQIDYSLFRKCIGYAINMQWTSPMAMR